jgi:hypothetical protein
LRRFKLKSTTTRNPYPIALLELLAFTTACPSTKKAQELQLLGLVKILNSA